MNTFFSNNKRDGIFDSIVEHVLQEGLITSYDVNKLGKTLVNNLGVKLQMPSEDHLYDANFDYDAYSFAITIEDYRHTKEFEQQLEKILNVFGYHVVKSGGTDIIKKTIEPRYPVVVNDKLKERNIRYLYHVTHNSNVQSINKIGLAPRGTETTFYHPNDRIYLVSCGMDTLTSITEILAEDKRKDPYDFSIYRTPVDYSNTYYLDDLATAKKYGIIAVFTLKNIPPKMLQMTTYQNLKYQR